jgi:hypothetical protein
VSQSLDQVNLAAAVKAGNNINSNAAKMSDSKADPREAKNESKNDSKQPQGLSKGNEQTRSQSILNKPFDEALEFSHSNSEDSVDTARDKPKQPKPQQSQQPQSQPPANSTKGGVNPVSSKSATSSTQNQQQQQPQFQRPPERKQPIDVCDRIVCFILFIFS